MDFKKLSILVVEDIPQMRKIICAVLDQLGVGRILRAQNGVQAFDMFCKESTDVVITDWHMEEMDGLELTRHIRKKDISPNKLVPVIVITGFSSPERVAAARDAGVTEFLIKPFSASDLAKRLEHVIKKPRDFIALDEYFGPDRRRRKAAGFSGPWRREEDGNLRGKNIPAGAMQVDFVERQGG